MCKCYKLRYVRSTTIVCGLFLHFPPSTRNYYVQQHYIAWDLMLCIGERNIHRVIAEQFQKNHRINEALNTKFVASVFVYEIIRLFFLNKFDFLITFLSTHCINVANVWVLRAHASIRVGTSSFFSRLVNVRNSSVRNLGLVTAHADSCKYVQAY